MANNVFVYCEIEGTQVQEVSQEGAADQGSQARQ